MMFKMYPVEKLVTHPANKDLFTDISESSPGFWLEFKASIEEFGILEPLIVNKETMQVRSGNQRLKAATELGIDEVPVIFVEDEDTEQEIRKMIASNVYRRALDPFKMFEYIGRLRIGQQGKKGGVGGAPPSVGKSSKETAKELKKDDSFISAADLFNSLPKEQQEALKAWFREIKEGEKSKTEGELIARLRKMEADALDKEAELSGLTDASKTAEEKAEALQEMLDERDAKIALLKDADEAIAERDSQIRVLEEQKRKLKLKLQEATSPDLGKHLKACIEWQSKVNVALKEIIDNWDELDGGDRNRFIELVQNTLATFNKGKPRKDALRLLEDK